MSCPKEPTKNHDACPLSVLLSVLSGSWTMYILWILSTEGSARFGVLKRKVEGISTKVLTERLRMLETEGILFRHYEATIPPQVTYGLTDRGQELIDILMQLNTLAQRWYPPQPERLQSATGDRLLSDAAHLKT
ncbi:MAG TPA: helix-turn-helix domain-containing protein [Coleofasciculaceae cyanobacterium]